MGAGHGGSSGRYDKLRQLAFDFAFVLPEPGMAEQAALAACGDDPAAAAKNRGIRNDPDLIQRRAASRSILAAHGHQLADVGQKQVGRLRCRWQGQ